MANLLKGHKASHDSSYEGYDLSHYVNFTSSTGHLLPVHFDLLLPGDKVSISTMMKTIMMPMNSASPVTIREHVDYYFVPLQTLYSLFPSLLSNTNEDASSSIFVSQNFKDGFPLVDIAQVKKTISNDVNLSDYFDFDNNISSANRLIEMFHYGMKCYHAGVMPDVNQNCNILLLQAYNAVWEYFFRDDTRYTFRPDRFNTDKYYDTLIIPVVSAIDLGLFSCNYRPLKKDPYTIASPSPLGNGKNNGFGDSSIESYVKQWLVNDDNIGVNPPTSSIANPNGDYPATSDKNYYTDTVFPNRTNASTVQQSLQQHRIAQAIEKLSSIWWTSGKNYKDQMENLFGVKNVQEDWTRPIYIGSDINEIQINPEVANVSTSQGDEILTNAGDIVGHGYGENTPKFSKFEAKTHGILLALYSCVPDAIYSADVFDFFNTYHKRNSFPNPVTDTLGEQPLFPYEVNAGTTGLVDGSIIGWLPRFHELKMKTNRAYGAFKNSLSYWLPSFNLEMQPNQIFGYRYSFYARPTLLNQIMLKEYDVELDMSAWTQQEAFNYPFFDSDPMLHFFRINCTKASKMSAFGIPNTYFG